MYFLIHRYRRLRALDLAVTAQRTVVSDFLFEKDELFAYLNLKNDELRLYEQCHELFSGEIPTSDLVLYLPASPEVLRRRITEKKVALEQRISDEHLEAVVNA